MAAWKYFTEVFFLIKNSSNLAAKLWLCCNNHENDYLHCNNVSFWGKALRVTFGLKYSWGANPGQTSIKCRDLACDVEPPLLKIIRIWPWNLKSNIFSPTLSSGVHFYIYEMPKDLGMRKIWAHGTRMQKNPQTRRTFSGFSRIFMELCGSKVQLAPSHGYFIINFLISFACIPILKLSRHNNIKIYNAVFSTRI